MAEVRVRHPFDRTPPVTDPALFDQNGNVLKCDIPTSHLPSAAPEDLDVIERENEEGAWKSRPTRIKERALEKTPKRLKNPSDLLVRTLTGGIYISLTLMCVLVSNVTTVFYLSVMSAICAGEFYYMLRSDAKLPNELLGIIASASFPVATWLFGVSGLAVTFVVFVLALLVWYVFWHPARVSDVAVSLFGAVYTGLIMSTALVLRMALPEPWGGVLLLGIFVSVWGNDVFAYLIGSALGKHKLAPRISPKKSWEGFIAGLAFSMFFWCMLTYIPGLNLSFAQALAFGLLSGLAGVLGDLVESRIKRNSGFKDSGTIMPGHGGLLDRCDSQFLVTLSSVLLLTTGGCLPNVLI